MLGSWLGHFQPIRSARESLYGSSLMLTYFLAGALSFLGLTICRNDCRTQLRVAGTLPQLISTGVRRAAALSFLHWLERSGFYKPRVSGQAARKLRLS